MSSPGRFAIGWYFHLPFVSSRIEVRDHAHGYLAPLLRLHREAETRALIAPTGSFLSLCEEHAPDILNDLKEAVADGLISIAATYFYETDPLSVPWSSLIEQVQADTHLKQRLFGSSPTWFVAPNFVWRPGLERLMRRFDIRGVVLDSRQMRASTATRAWRWETGSQGAVHHDLVTLDTEAWEHRRLRELSSGGASTKVVFRDWGLTRALTFGNDGAIHRPDPVGAIDRALAGEAAASGDGELVALVDDGDRVRGMSLHGYRTLLDKVGPGVDWAELLDEPPASPPIRELAGFDPPGIGDLLRGTEDARFYWRLLEELRQYRWSRQERRDQMALEDVFYAYWPGVGRRQRFLDEALGWIEEGQRRLDDIAALEDSVFHDQSQEPTTPTEA